MLTAVAGTLLKHRKQYYGALEAASRDLDVTDWLLWFAAKVIEAQRRSLAQVEFIIGKARLLDRVRGKYRDVILPMTVPRRLDAVLEDSKQAVLDMQAMLDQAGVVEQDSALRQAAGQAFQNTSRFTLRDLRLRANRQQLKADFEAGLDGFSPNVQDILDNFGFRDQIPRLSNADALGTQIEKLTSEQGRNPVDLVEDDQLVETSAQ